MKVKTALGKTLDMGGLIQRNEKIRAVGNMSVNARGDTIDSNGKIIKSANEKVANSYSKTVGNKSAQVQEKKVQRQKPVIAKEDVELKDVFDEYDQEDIMIEQVKKQQRGKNDN